MNLLRDVLAYRPAVSSASSPPARRSTITITGRGAPPLNDITPISRGRFWLGCFTFALLVMILLPTSVVRSAASHWPQL